MWGFTGPAPELGFYVVAEKTEGCKWFVEMVPVIVLCARHGARLLTDTHWLLTLPCRVAAAGHPTLPCF